MTNRHNQWRNKHLRLNASEDDDLDDKKHVMGIMNGMGFTCRSNLHLIVPRDIEQTGKYMLVEIVREHLLDEWKLAARPDVACYGRNGRLKLLIEVDGSIHRSQLDGRDLYNELGIKHVVLNKEYVAKEGITWKDYIEHEVKRLGVAL